MKLAPRTFRIGWDVHAWAGIVSALVLYVMFFAGGLTLFQSEIEAWQEPCPNIARPIQPVFARAVDEHRLDGVARVGVHLRPSSKLLIEWEDARGEHHLRVDRTSGEARPSRSGIGHFLYELHFLEPLPGGIYLAGVLAIVLGVALVTGLVIQWKDLVRQLVRIRSHASLRVWTSDLHKVLGVFGIPFQLLFAWSGAFLCLAYFTIAPVMVKTVFRGDATAAYAAYGEVPPPPIAANEPGPLPDLDAFVARAEAMMPGLRVSYVGVQSVRDARSSVHVYGAVDGVTFGTGQILFAAKDGALLGVSDPRAAPTVARVSQWMFALHFARFSLPWRIVYALFAFATCAVIATGNVVWLERRDPSRTHRGNRILEAATIGTCAGFPLAVAAMFVANRVLLATASSSPSRELAVFVIAWIVAFVWSFFRPARAAARGQLYLASALWLATLLIDLVVAPPRIVDPQTRTMIVGFALLAVGSFAFARATQPRSQVRLVAPRARVGG